jgi:hypothetical protein
MAVEGLQWRDDYPGPYISSFSFSVPNRERKQVIEFRLSQLEGCRNPANRPVRSSIEEQIRNALQDLSKH